MKKPKWKSVVVVTRDDCVFCDRAKELLNAYGVSYQIRNVNFAINADLKGFLQEAGFTTVPIIFADGQLIGGYAMLREALKNA